MHAHIFYLTPEKSETKWILKDLPARLGSIISSFLVEKVAESHRIGLRNICFWDLFLSWIWTVPMRQGVKG